MLGKDYTGFRIFLDGVSLSYVSYISILISFIYDGWYSFGCYCLPDSESYIPYLIECLLKLVHITANFKNIWQLQLIGSRKV